MPEQNSQLFGQIENWRNRLLDIGNRNPLINTSFNPTRGVLELIHPGSEAVWRKLITSGEAGSRAMRFPWKRDLVPPPPSQKPVLDAELEIVTDNPAEPEEVKDWNPPIERCIASSRLKADDLLTGIGDRVLDRRVRTLNGHAQLSISEQGTLRSSDSLTVRLMGSSQKSGPTDLAKPIMALRLNEMTIGEAVELVEKTRSAMQTCVSVMQTAKKNYHTLPSYTRLIEDIAHGKSYIEQRQVVEESFASYSSDLPDESKPFHVESWKGVIQGVESADRLVKTFGSSPILKQTLCSPGLLNRDSLSEAVADLEDAWQQVNRIWTEQVNFVDLSKTNGDSKDPRKRSATDLRACFSNAASEFESVAGRLGAFLKILGPGKVVPLERIAQDAEVIHAIRTAEIEVRRCDNALAAIANGLQCELSDENILAATWILNADERTLGSPLTHKVATDSGVRSQVQSTVLRMKAINERMAESSRFFGKLFHPSQNVSTGFVPKDLDLQTLAKTLRELVASYELIDEWIPFARWRDRMADAGLDLVVEELIKGVYSPDDAVDVVLARLYQQLFDTFVDQIPHIADFDGVRHEQIREKYRELDAWEIKAASTRVREYQLSRADRPRIGWLAPVTSELGILKRETEKKRRHMPLRKLFNEVPGVLQRLKPCIMMSPLSVSTFLQTEALKFELVIFDEASQVFPWDAIGSIYRGTQLIVAGDDKQLPPTSFFSRADIESEDEEDDIGDFESILSLCKSVNMPNKRLRWHYRSRRERRLNVAVTRAREAISLVASVRSSDMDLSGSNSVGAALLKAYLEFAERGVDSLSQAVSQTQAACESPFEEEVAAALMRHGLEPIPQVGCGGFRIDLALKHPTHPGIFCLGIECDGATYHSSKTARDRDRIRQSILENLGWRICRIWSTDWIRNPELQIGRILSQYELASAQPPDAGFALDTSIETEFDDLQPQIITESETQTLLFQKIEDVPTSHISETAVRIVTRSGTIDWTELTSLTSRELGFARTGKKIRARIELILNELLELEILQLHGERVSLGESST